MRAGPQTRGSALDPGEVTLIVIAKEPVPGRAKTRLAPAVGDDGAAELAEAALADTLEAVAAAARAGGNGVLLALDGEPGPWLPSSPPAIRIVEQRGDGLGERLGAAFDDAAGPALLVGMDTPQLRAGALAAGCALLCRPGCDAVIGLAEDGGFWALGLRRPDASLFEAVPMSEGDTGARQLEALRAAGLATLHLPVLADVDEIGDALRVAALAPGTRFAAALAPAHGHGAMRALTVPRLAALLAIALLLVLLIAGCGSKEGFPPPAEPASSPPLQGKPAGIVIDLPGEAEGVAADPKTGIVAVSVRDPDKLLLVSDLVPPEPQKGEVMALASPSWHEVKVPEAARHMQLAAPGGPILATAEYTDELIEVALPGGRVTTTKVGDFPHDATRADNGRIFVADEGGDSISVVEGGAVTATLPAPEQPGGIAASSTSIGVITVAERVLGTWDAETLEPTGEVGAGAGPTHIVAAPDGRFYVADTQGDAILVFEAGPEPRLLDRANLPGSPYGIAVDARSEMLWVTQADRNRVVGFELTDLAPKRVVSYATVRQPNTVAVDPATGIVYVAGRAEGELQAIDPARVPGGRLMAAPGDAERASSDGVLGKLSDAVRPSAEAKQPPAPMPPDRGPFNRGFWRSPLRGEWLTSFLGSMLLPLVLIAGITGFLSHAAYDPDLGANGITGGFDDGFYFFDWPTSPAWLYSVTQGLHLLAGLGAIPILIAKLWSVIPKLFERPPVSSVAIGIERLSIATLVGSSLFLFATGTLNITYWLPFPFPFTPAHYYAAIVFTAALALHVLVKLPIVRDAFARNGVFRPLGEGIEMMRAADASEDSLAPTNPASPTISRRGLIAAVGGASVGIVALNAGTSILSPLRETALLSPRGQSYGDGPTDFQVNKTAEVAGIDPAQTGAGWRLVLSGGERDVELSRDELLAMDLKTERLPIACVEGWTTWQTWTGVPLRELAALAGFERATVFVESLQEAGAFAQTTLNDGQVDDERSLLALIVNGADLSPDHGYPARVIVPALPGVHNTKWVKRMTFTEA